MDLTILVGHLLSEGTSISLSVALDIRGFPAKNTQHAFQEFSSYHPAGKAKLGFDYIAPSAEYPDGVVFLNESDLASAREQARKSGASVVGVGASYLDEEHGKANLKFYS